jgi:hypothetical protein
LSVGSKKKEEGTRKKEQERKKKKTYAVSFFVIRILRLIRWLYLVSCDRLLEKPLAIN